MRGITAVRRFVSNGGGYLGICAGAQLASEWLDLLAGAKQQHKILGLIGAGQFADVLCSHNGDSLAIKWRNGPVFAPAHALPKGVECVLAIDDAVAVGGKRKLPARVRSQMRRRSAVVRCGRVVACGPHPECTRGAEALTVQLLRLTLEK